MDRLLIVPPGHDPSAPAIKVEHLSVTFDGTSILEEVSFHVLPGQRVAVVGPNGAGKTTLFRVIAGTLPSELGRVDVYGHTPGKHVCIAYVPQRSQIDWRFPVTVEEVVMMGRVRKLGFMRWPRRQDWALVQAVLGQFDLQDYRGRQIGELSGGQQQRVFLARAVAQGAELVLLDEPLTGLDLPSQEAIFHILDDLREAGVTVMVATHDLNLAADRFDLVMLLNRSLIGVGPPNEVFKSEKLLQAYGRHMHMVKDGDGLIILADTCCEGEDEADG